MFLANIIFSCFTKFSFCFRRNLVHRLVLCEQSYTTNGNSVPECPSASELVCVCVCMCDFCICERDSISLILFSVLLLLSCSLSLSFLLFLSPSPSVSIEINICMFVCESVWFLKSRSNSLATFLPPRWISFGVIVHYSLFSWYDLRLETTRIFPIKIHSSCCFSANIIKIIRFKNCPSQGVHNVICLDIKATKSC